MRGQSQTTIELSKTVATGEKIGGKTGIPKQISTKLKPKVS